LTDLIEAQPETLSADVWPLTLYPLGARQYGTVWPSQVRRHPLPVPREHHTPACSHCVRTAVAIKTSAGATLSRFPSPPIAALVADGATAVPAFLYPQSSHHNPIISYLALSHSLRRHAGLWAVCGTCGVARAPWVDAATHRRTALGSRSCDRLLSVFHAFKVAAHKPQRRLGPESNRHATSKGRWTQRLAAASKRS